MGFPPTGPAISESSDRRSSAIPGHSRLHFMRNTSNRVTRARRTCLEKAGYVLAGVGIVLLLLVGVVLPFNLFGGQHHYYRVAPAENGWIMAAALTALGALLVLIGRALRTTNR